jgi:hypothetical protein
MLNITKQIFKAFSSVAVIVTMILGMTLGVSAQSQNPSV